MTSLGLSRSDLESSGAVQHAWTSVATRYFIFGGSLCSAPLLGVFADANTAYRLNGDPENPCIVVPDLLCWTARRECDSSHLAPRGSGGGVGLSRLYMTSHDKVLHGPRNSLLSLRLHPHVVVYCDSQAVGRPVLQLDSRFSSIVG